MKNVHEKLSFVFGALVLLALLHMSQVGAARELVPEALEPDACVRSQKVTEDCKRWYYLTEVEHPDAWQYTVRNHGEKRKRWYAVQQKVAVLPEKPSRIIVLEGVNFDYDKASLRSDAVPVLNKDAKDLNSTRTVKVKIVGHADAKGTSEYNKELSEQRAESVRNYLVSQGVDSNRLSSEGRGESDPIAPNTTPNGKDNPAGRAQNRRVELHVWDAVAGR